MLVKVERPGKGSIRVEVADGETVELVTRRAKLVEQILGVADHELDANPVVVVCSRGNKQIVLRESGREVLAKTRVRSYGTMIITADSKIGEVTRGQEITAEDLKTFAIAHEVVEASLVVSRAKMRMPERTEEEVLRDEPLVNKLVKRFLGW